MSTKFLLTLIASNTFQKLQEFVIMEFFEMNFIQVQSKFLAFGVRPWMGGTLDEIRLLISAMVLCSLC